MSERLSAIYLGKQVCTYDLVDENEQYIEEVRSELRMASQEGQLFCPDCKNRLVLCAGAIRTPYFRHFDVDECKYTINMRSATGRRKYLCRKLLFHLIQKGNFSHVELQENNLTPVLFECKDEKIGYVYLDGKTRNYKELREEMYSYITQGIKLFFFLSVRYMSNGNNLTSDEAEISRLNNHVIFYIDEENNFLYMRKAYKNRRNYREYFTQKYDWQQIQINESGEITDDFLIAYNEFTLEEKKSFTKVIRVPVEDGIDEIYADMDYVLMDSLGEIWILPEFARKIDGYESDRENRIQFLEEVNERIKEEEWIDLVYTGYQLQKEIETKCNSWDWRI